MSEAGSYEGKMDALADLQRRRAALDAEELQLLAELAVTPVPRALEWAGKEWVAEEIAAVLRISGVSATARLHNATDLVHRFPATLARLAAGDITVLHALSLVEYTGGLSDEVASAVETRVLPRASEQTVGQFRRAIRRAVTALDSRQVEARHQDAMTRRRVVITHIGDGMAEIWALVSSDVAASFAAAVQAIADQSPADSRTADQRRADALATLATLALTTDPDGARGMRPTINVVVPVSTLLGLSDSPGELNGEPIPAEMARRLAEDPTGTWRRILTDPAGRLIDYGRASYRPPTTLARHVRARDRTCRGPGCQRQARRCDLDHRTAWHDGGETNADNLHPLCPRHHAMKHTGGWAVRQLPDGTTRWTTPSGRTVDVAPAAYDTGELLGNVS